jgi:hypothetical protein
LFRLFEAPSLPKISQPTQHPPNGQVSSQPQQAIAEVYLKHTARHVETKRKKDPLKSSTNSGYLRQVTRPAVPADLPATPELVAKQYKKQQNGH